MTIGSCTANLDGGGIYLAVESVFSMSGGNIEGCKAQQNGGDVYAADDADFTMEGGMIKKCKERLEISGTK